MRNKKLFLIGILIIGSALILDHIIGFTSGRVFGYIFVGIGAVVISFINPNIHNGQISKACVFKISINAKPIEYYHPLSRPQIEIIERILPQKAEPFDVDEFEFDDYAIEVYSGGKKTRLYPNRLNKTEIRVYQNTMMVTIGEKEAEELQKIIQESVLNNFKE